MGVRGSYTCHYQSQHYPVICHALPQQLGNLPLWGPFPLTGNTDFPIFPPFNNKKGVIFTTYYDS